MLTWSTSNLSSWGHHRRTIGAKPLPKPIPALLLGGMEVDIQRLRTTLHGFLADNRELEYKIRGLTKLLFKPGG